eukprot:10864364-Alexandrium_andersonii.AAC.1
MIFHVLLGEIAGWGPGRLACESRGPCRWACSTCPPLQSAGTAVVLSRSMPADTVVHNVTFRFTWR